ncbi:MAG: hypothetical protein GC193_10175 [Cryomorphaceae bacterium]|nr:hypothetical protein [Cryomorphaceae bacterium]
MLNGYLKIQFLFIPLLLLAFVSSQAQSFNTSLSVAMPELSGSIFINGAHGTDVNVSASIDSLPSGECLIDIALSDSALTHLRMNVFLIEGQAYALSIAKSQDEFMAIFGLSGGQGSALDVQSFNAPNTACSFPCTTSRLNILNQQIEEIAFERQRLSFMKRSVPEYCLTTQQIGEVALNLDDETYRLDFLLFAYEFCFDQRNFIRLQEMIVLQRNKLKFLNLVD